MTASKNPCHLAPPDLDPSIALAQTARQDFKRHRASSTDRAGKAGARPIHRSVATTLLGPAEIDIPRLRWLTRCARFSTPRPVMAQQTLEIVTLPLRRLTEASSQARKEIAELLRRAALDRGFFRIGGVPENRINRILALGPKFFDMPLEYKMRYPWNIANNCGYSPLQTQTLGGNKLPDHNESMRLRAQLPSSEWPDIPVFESEAREYLSWATDVADHVFAVLEEAFQVKPGLLKEMHHDHVYTLRLIKYPTGVQETQDRAGTHTDFTTISFVVSDRRGLEVEDRQGGWRWIDPEPGCITCNFGDMMRFLIPDIQSTPHRVRGDGDAAQTERYTAALFFHCDPDRHLNLDGTEEGPTSREFLHNKHLETQKPTVVS